MKYLADILTLSRFLLALTIWLLALVGGPVEVVLFLFLIAELTDAFDGTCSRKWPFKKGEEPAYRKYAAKYDMITDALLWFTMVFYAAYRINLLIGGLVFLITVIICLIVELIIYGKLFGHPDDCKKNSLCKKNFPLAKKIILARRFFYLLTIVFIAIWMLVVSKFSLCAKIIILSICLLVGIFLWFFLKQRRKNISRDAVDIEKKLEKKSN